jgi:hypothetical protein
MKKRAFLSSMVFLALAACSLNTRSVEIRGSGAIRAEDRTVGGVNGVTLATSGELTVALGDAESLRIEADDNLLPYIETRTWNGMLTIQQKEQTQLTPTKPIRYSLTVKTLDSVGTSSSGNIEAPAVTAGRFFAAVNSSGDATIWVVESLNAALNSSGNVKYYGRPTVKASANSGGRTVSLGEKQPE